MKDKLRGAFQELKMPEDCASRIESKLCKSDTKQKGFYAEPVSAARGGWLRTAAAAAALLAVVLLAGKLCARYDGEASRHGALIASSSGPESIENQYATQKNARAAIQDKLENSWQDPLFDEYLIRDDEGNVYNRNGTALNADEDPGWLLDAHSRLYFTANGENIDITDRITLEDHFLYTFTSQANVKWVFLVGRITEGPYEDLSSVGWMVFHWDDWEEEWICSGGTLWRDYQGEDWPWLASAMEELNALWDICLPETDPTAPYDCDHPHWSHH